MRDRLRRALALSLDAALALALVECAITLVRASPLRTANSASVLLFSALGVALLLTAPFALALGFVPLRARGARVALASLALASLALCWKTDASVTLAVLAAVSARAALAPDSRAGFARSAASLFALSMALVSFSSSDGLRSYSAARGWLVAAVFERIAPIVPRPRLALAPPSARTSEEGPWTVEQVLRFDLRGDPELCAELPTLRLVARNGAVLTDARSSVDGAPVDAPLNPSPSRAGAREAQCEGGSLEARARCVREALGPSGPLALTVRAALVEREALASVDTLLRGTLELAHARAPLSRSIVAVSCARALEREVRPARAWWGDVRSTRALLVLSAPSIRPGLARGAVTLDELSPAIDALRAGRCERSELCQLARRSAPWFDRVVALQRAHGDVTRFEAYTARYALYVVPSRWYVALYDLELDPRGEVNRADLSRDIVRALMARFEPRREPLQTPPNTP